MTKNDQNRYFWLEKKSSISQFDQKLKKCPKKNFTGYVWTFKSWVLNLQPLKLPATPSTNSLHFGSRVKIDLFSPIYEKNQKNWQKMAKIGQNLDFEGLVV